MALAARLARGSSPWATIRNDSFTSLPHTGGMRALLLLPLGCLAGCAVPVIHRDLFDAAYSLSAGQDCSIVRLDKGETYCRPVEPPPEPPTTCTRSLGTVDCWRAAPASQLGVADGPSTLTPLQEADRTRLWPPL